MMQTSLENTVIVAGAGYAGVLAANRLAGKLEPGMRVLLVSLADTLTDRIRLHERAARGRDVELPLSSLLHPRVERIAARVLGVDPGRHALAVESAAQRHELHYRALILALGSRVESPIPHSTTPHAAALADPDSAYAFHQALGALPSGARVAVIGGGLSAIELSSEIAEARPELEVVLLCDELARGLRGAAQAALRHALAESGVVLREQAKVRALVGDVVHYCDDRPAESFALSVVAAGFSPTPLPPAFALPRAADGRLPVDEHLRVHGTSDVFAAGDLAAPPAETIGRGEHSTRFGCATALPLGAHAADQVLRLLRRDALVPYRFSYAAQCISVGRRSAVIAFVDRDDRPTGKLLTGRKAALFKELVCRFVLTALRLERWVAGLYAWPGRRRRLSLPKAPAQQLPG